MCRFTQPPAYLTRYCAFTVASSRTLMHAVALRAVGFFALILAGGPGVGHALPPTADHHPAIDAATAADASPLTHRQTAHTLAVAGHVRLPYSSNDAPDTWDGVTAADADPSRTGNVLSIYGNASYRGGSCGEGGTCVAVVSDWNREYLWVKSYAIDDNVVVIEL